jgi:hypothetical protein
MSTSFCSLQPLSMMLLLLGLSWPGPLPSIGCTPASSGSMRGYWGLRLIAWMHTVLGAVAVIPSKPQAATQPFLPATYLDRRGVRKTHGYRALLWPGLPLLSPSAPALVRLVGGGDTRGGDLCSQQCGRPGSTTGGAS